MAQNTVFRLDPVALAAGTYATNICYPAAAGASAVGYTARASYIILRHIRIVNTTAGALTFRLHKTTTGGAATAANAVIGWDLSIAAGSYHDWYGQLALRGDVAADFLVGGGSAGGLTIEGEGEIGSL